MHPSEIKQDIPELLRGEKQGQWWAQRAWVTGWQGPVPVSAPEPAAEPVPGPAGAPSPAARRPCAPAPSLQRARHSHHTANNSKTTYKQPSDHRMHCKINVHARYSL